MMGFNRGLILGEGCFSSGFFSNGWNWLIGIGVLLVIIVGVILIVTKNKKSSPDDSVLEALKLKFAQGEMNEEEYRKRKSVLEGE